MDEITEHSLKTSGLSQSAGLTATPNFQFSTEITNDKSHFNSDCSYNNFLSNSWSTTTSNSLSSISSYNIVKDTVQDVIQMQNNALLHVKDVVQKQKQNYVTKEQFEKVSHDLEEELLKHEKTKIQLEKEVNRRQFTESEVESLKQTYRNEKKKTIEEIKTARAKASRESQRCDFIQTKLYDMEIEIQKKEGTIEQKNIEIEKLKLQLQSVKKMHKKHIEDQELEALQSQYMSKSLADRARKRNPL